MDIINSQLLGKKDENVIIIYLSNKCTLSSKHINSICDLKQNLIFIYESDTHINYIRFKRSIDNLLHKTFFYRGCDDVFNLIDSILESSQFIHAKYYTWYEPDEEKMILPHNLDTLMTKINEKIRFGITRLLRNEFVLHTNFFTGNKENFNIMIKIYKQISALPKDTKSYSPIKPSKIKYLLEDYSEYFETFKTFEHSLLINW